MHFRQKLIFMALGSILTLAGYLLATLASDVTAQDTKVEEFLGDVVCDNITVRKGGVIRFPDGGQIIMTDPTKRGGTILIPFLKFYIA